MSDTSTPLARLTAETVAIGGPLTSLVSHMVQVGELKDRDPAEIPVILTDLIGPTIEGITEGWPAGRIDDAADILHAACERICSDIFIVPPPNRAERRARRRPR